MLIALEGPDCAGKSTVWRELKHRIGGAKFVCAMPGGGKPDAQLIATTAHLWEQLYDPSTLYICDRCKFVSDRVYAAVRGDPMPDYSEWRSRVKLLYFTAPLSELLKRRADASLSEALLLAYDREIPRWTYARVDATLSIAELVRKCEAVIGVWR